MDPESLMAAGDRLRDALSAGSLEESGRVENALTGAIRRVSEDAAGERGSAELTASLAELAAVDAGIARARRSYNDAVMTYNTAILTFPNSAVAAIAGFRELVYFEFDAEGSEPLDAERPGP